MLKALSVSELNEIIKNIFDAEELLQYIKVYGEVSNFSFVRGNLYFNLKDENALIPCVMFGASSSGIKEGDQVMITGALKFYAKSGKLNLYVTTIVPYGSGVLFKNFVELKNKLELEGVFDEKYKKPIPDKIKTIGVITSPTGAVLHDIVTVSHRRNPYLNIIVYPARVQGEGAENTIIKGLKYFDKQKDVDVIIIARGGGSIEDLQPFNTESLAREIIKNSKPVVSAVGHETDFTICDFASSLRVATPSVAGEIVSVDVVSHIKELNSNIKKLHFLIFSLYDDYYSKLDLLTNKLNNLIETKKIKYEFNLKNQISKLKNINFINLFERVLEINYNKLESLNVQSIIDRGFARILKDNKVVTSIKNLSNGDKLTIGFRDGSVESQVSNIRSKKQ